MTIVVGIDIETTGIKQEDGHRMVEFGAVIYDLDSQKKLGKFIQRINPQRPIDPKAQAVHGISFESLSKMPTLEDIGPKIVKVLNIADFFVAHNGEGFDIPFIRNELFRVGLNVNQKPLVDTMLQGRWACAMGKSPRLSELCFACAVDYDSEQAHGAEYDISVMMKAFFIGHEKGFFKIKSEELA